MSTSKQTTKSRTHLPLVAFGAALLVLLFSWQGQAFPVSQVTFHTDAPFAGTNGVHSLTSSDGLLTVAGWADTNALTATNLYQWFWLLGVNSGSGDVNGVLINDQESMTLQYPPSVGASLITFLYTGNQCFPTTPAQVAISGFTINPGASATYPYGSNPLRISNIQYANGTLTFGYLYDAGGTESYLFLANPAASAGQTLKIYCTGPNWSGTCGNNRGAALFGVDGTEAYGGSQVHAVEVGYNITNAYTTPDGALTVRSFADQLAMSPTNFGTYLDQCFGPYGGHQGAISGNETVTLQFDSGHGLSRLESVYSSGQVSIYGFTSDPGFTDPANGSFGAQYSSGLLSFYPMSGAHFSYFFTNRAASAGQTLRINADPNSGYYFAIAGIGHSDLHTLFGTDIPSGSSSYTTSDALLTISAYSDTPGATPATFNETVYNALDWLGITGGSTSQAIEGTESMTLQFASSSGLSGLGVRYTGGTIILDGLASDPGLVGPGGVPLGGTYANGSLTFTASNTWHPSESVVYFTNPAASAGQTLSLHTDGSSGAQITLTRINYTNNAAVVTLSISPIGNNQVVLTWPTGTLQQSPTVTGTYTNVTGATSPYTNAISGQQSYFRVKVQ